MATLLPYDGKPGPITIGPESSVEDLQAIVDIVADHIGLTRFTNKHCKSFGGSNPWPQIDKLGDYNQSRARYRTGKITICDGHLNGNPKKLLQTLAHETIHFHTATRGHGAEFKKMERKVLRELFGMGIRYNKAYARELYDLDSGEILYRRIDKIRESWGNPKAFDIGETVRYKVKYDNGIRKTYIGTVLRRNKKTVSIKITAEIRNGMCHDIRRPFRWKVPPKNLSRVKASEKPLERAAEASEGKGSSEGPSELTKLFSLS